MQNNFFIRKIDGEYAKQVIKEIGFDKTYAGNAAAKYEFCLFKINNLSSPQANILKQIALSVGADCAVHREVITCKVERSSVLLGGTKSQIKIMCEKIKNQPFKLAQIAILLLEQFDKSPKPLTIRNKVFDWGKKTYIMGILNTTPDSFSDGGEFLDVNKAFKQAEDMIAKGVDIIDIGGESTRPNADIITVEEEITRTTELIKKIRSKYPEIVISIDTRNSQTAQIALDSGVDIINDVSGFEWDPNMIDIIAKTQCPVVIMHSKGSPQNMQDNPVYENNIIDEIYESLYNKVYLATEAGIKKENIIIDPGIGFGKTLDHNIEIIKRIEEFDSIGCPVLVGISRKSIVKAFVGDDIKDRDTATLALNSYLASKGVNILRVHDYESHIKSFKIIDKLLY